MKTVKPARPMWCGLSETQWKCVVYHMEYIYDGFTPYENSIHEDDAEIKNFISNLESWSLISPNDRDTLWNYATDLKIEALNLWKQHEEFLLKRTGGIGV